MKTGTLTRISDIARQINVRAHSKSPFPVFAVTKHDGLIPSAEYFKKQVYSRDSEGYKVVARGQFAYATIHLDEGSIGLLETADHCIISPMYTVFEVDVDRVYAPYLLRLLKSSWALSQYSNIGSGSVHRRRSITFDTLAQLQVMLPTLEDQKKITIILNGCDMLRRKRQVANRKVNELIRAVFIEMFGDPDLNSHSFPTGTIRELVESANYGTSEKANEESGRFPILRMNNITYEGSLDLTSLKYIDLDSRTQDRYLSRRGDLLFNRTNSKELVGKTAVYEMDTPMAIAGYLVRVRMNERGNPYYVSGYLNSAHGKRALMNRANSIVGMANINAQEVQNLAILIPPIDMQNQFQQVIESIRNSQKKNLASERKLDELQASLSSQFFEN
jgi:type I restriction enzyme S subunit